MVVIVVLIIIGIVMAIFNSNAGPTQLTYNDFVAYVVFSFEVFFIF